MLQDYFLGFLKGHDASGNIYEMDAKDDDDYCPLWFVMDEFGSCIRHSDDPTFAIATIYYVPVGTSFSILWPLRDVEYGGLFQLTLSKVFFINDSTSVTNKIYNVTVTEVWIGLI